jgi:RNA polymerase sigma-70 factor (ECF subfamily)
MSSNEFNSALLDIYPNLERFAYRLTLNPENARDLIQETFLKALLNRDKFQDSTNIRAWAFTIMRNTFINNYHREERQVKGYDFGSSHFFKNKPAIFESPESRYSHNELEKVVEGLDDDFRVPFQMHTNGFKYKEIAERLNVNIGTVKSRIFFSRQKLMHALNDYQ